MKVLFERLGELSHLEGPATAVLNQLEELATDSTFVANQLFFSTNEAAAVAELDQRSNLLDDFTIMLADNRQPTANAKAGCLTLTRYERKEIVKEDEMTSNEIGNEIAALLWNQEGSGELIYSGTADRYVDPDEEPLDIMQMDEADEYEDDDYEEEQVFYGAGGHHPQATGSYNQRKGGSQSSDELESPLDILQMNWDEPAKTKPTKNKRADADYVEPLPDPEALF